MWLHDTYIIGRERILHWILGTDPNLTLNSRGSSSKGTTGGSSPARNIKESLNQIKSLAFSENGKVDYQKIIRNPLYRSYRELTGGLSHFDCRTLHSIEEKLAFWVNLYNAMVIDAVIQENVQKSVTESRLGILAFFQKAAYQVNGLRYGLTDIEHGVLRANRGFPYFPGSHFPSKDLRLETVIQPFDPRIHFALNCASNSCPLISVYTPEKIHEQLDLATRNFIKSDLVIHSDQKITVSKIFHWYKGDFGGKPGILSFLSKYVNDPDAKRWLANNHPSIQISYHPYDWGLNKISA